MLKWLVVGSVVLLLLVVGAGSAVVPDVRDTVGELAGGDGGSQSAAQISPAEFGQAQEGMSRNALRALIGDPEAKSQNEIEGMSIECWYYGIGAASGSYQLCFANDRLRSKFRYSR